MTETIQHVVFGDVPCGGIFTCELLQCVDSSSPYRFFCKISDIDAVRCNREGEYAPSETHPMEQFDEEEPVELYDHPCDSVFVEKLGIVTDQLTAIGQHVDGIIDSCRVAEPKDIDKIDRIITLLNCVKTMAGIK